MYMIGIKEAAKLLGVTPKTLRLWEKQGKITSHRTEGQHRRYVVSELIGSRGDKLLTKEESIAVFVGIIRLKTQKIHREATNQKQFYITIKIEKISINRYLMQNKLQKR